MLHFTTAEAPARTSAVPTEKTHGCGGALKAGAKAFVGRFSLHKRVGPFWLVCFGSAVVGVRGFCIYLSKSDIIIHPF